MNGWVGLELMVLLGDIFFLKETSDSRDQNFVSTVKKEDR